MKLNTILNICLLQSISASTGFCPEDLVKDQSPSCIEAAKNVDSKFPKLSKCTKSSSLYFSTLDDVCKDDCRDTIIEASSYIAKNCPLSTKAWERKPSANSWLKSLFSNPAAAYLDSSDTLTITATTSSYLKNGIHIYHGWKTKNVTELACKKFEGHYERCLKEVISAADFVENSPYWKPPSGMTYEEWMSSKVCSECKKQFYQLVNPGEEPVLYYWNIRKTDDLRTSQEKFCKYNKAM
ncbi:hypothetical protein CONCODRAFT_79684 [Conidiobolus coronatus NRRL 28638]|uniref:Uncharacterized protein n=1 Tax=Conidiobolus coronatus (strain ATCC 28846 / CBS 209.66 / NRRL 28638) TaxID=796925 RepID=A0A137P182_CONC2|nr:hypothetical protein CONCODRAFT_79684 [Conidiobolus coronatus NRRL 28638]|eukprot:KXN68634.1 hypothetical protein CONCODRAFT_79684 [Conidiobolus coronatus NRRL 28638]